MQPNPGFRYQITSLAIAAAIGAALFEWERSAKDSRSTAGCFIRRSGLMSPMSSLH